MKRCEIVAHRGGARLWPENSRMAIAGARALVVEGASVDGIEVDVHLTRDDRVVVLHDATLDRTTTASGPVRERAFADLADVGVKDREGAVKDRGLPSLDDLVRAFADTRGVLSVELKNDARGARYPGLAAAVVDALVAAGARDRAFVHAFDWAYLDEARARDAQIALGGNVERETLRSHDGLYAIFDALRAKGARDVNIDHRLMDKELVDAAHQKGLRVTVWTVNDPAEMERFLKSGVDTIVTDRPDTALALRAAFEREIGFTP